MPVISLVSENGPTGFSVGFLIELMKGGGLSRQDERTRHFNFNRAFIFLQRYRLHRLRRLQAQHLLVQFGVIHAQSLSEPI